MRFGERDHVDHETLSALVDGELSPSQRRAVYAHLQECASCRHASDGLARVSGLVASLPRLVAPQSFVSQTLTVRRNSPAALGGRVRWAAAAAATLAAAITLGGLVQPQAVSEPPVETFIDRHVSLHAGVESGAHVLYAVNGR